VQERLPGWVLAVDARTETEPLGDVTRDEGVGPPVPYTPASESSVVGAVGK